MEFGTPVALALAALALPVLWLALRSGRRGGVPVPAAAGLAGVRPGLRLRLARALPVLRVVAIALLATGLARPRIGNANAIVPAEGIDIALSLDISSSMTTTNLGAQDRLSATKEVIREFVRSRENDRVGLVVFQRDALPLVPPSLDYDALDRIVSEVESGIMPDGTGIGVGLAEAVNMLRESDAASRIVILLTDGQHNAESIRPLEAADLARALRIRVYTIGVYERARGPVELDEPLMTRIAEETGGKYFVAATPEDLLAVYEEIGDLEKSRVGRERYEQFEELGPWFIAAAAAVLGLELLLAATWLRRPL